MIYLVEDDESIRELVIYTLKSQGMEAKGFERPSQFWKELDKEIPSLILMSCLRRRMGFPYSRNSVQDLTPESFQLLC